MGRTILLGALLALAACTPGSETGDDVGQPEGTDGEGGGSEAEDFHWEPFPDDGYVPTDADGDTIADVHEGPADTDGDTTPNDHDTDSDGDGFDDSVEAGDSDVRTGPYDTDTDGIPDFVDLDSDNDGLSDADERTAGTDPRDADSDDDGAGDVVEVAAGTDPTDPADSPHARGDFVFVVPFEQPPEPERDTLVFGTDIQMADVYFMVDRSASMGSELRNLYTGLSTTIVPAVDAVIPEAWFGACIFDMCPFVNRCSDSGTPVWLRNLQNLAEDPTLTSSALEAAASLGTCNGTAEPYVTAPWIIATGDSDGPLDDWPAGRIAPRTCADPAAIGYPCFRPGAVPIIVLFGDESFLGEGYRGCDPDGGRAPDFAAMVAALNAIHARFIGVGSSDEIMDGLRDTAAATGAVSTAGDPLAFRIPGDGTGLGDQVVDAIELLAAQVPMDISAQAVDVVEGPTDTVDATIFIDHLEPNTTGGVADPRDPTRVCVGGLPVADGDGDTRADYFPDVLPGTIVCFDIIPRENTTVPATSAAQLFRAEIQVLGETVTVLDRRDVYFLVPPETYVGPPI